MQRFVMTRYDQFIKDKKDITKLKENIKNTNFACDDIPAAQDKIEGTTSTEPPNQDTEINKDNNYQLSTDNSIIIKQKQA